MAETLTNEGIQLPNASEPPQRPLRQFWLAFADSHKVATNMSPAEPEHKIALFDLLYRFVTTVAIDHQHAIYLPAEMRLWHVVRTTRAQDKHYRVFPSEQPQPPVAPHFSSFFNKNTPSCFIGLIVLRLQMLLPNRFSNRGQHRLDPFQPAGDRT